mgnify:CR=1 FL=1
MHPIIAGGTQTEWLVADRGDDFSLDIDVAVDAIKELNPDLDPQTLISGQSLKLR